MLSDQQDVLHCLVEQFTQQLNGFKISEINTRSEGRRVPTVEMVMDVPTQLEINTAITKLKNDKAPELVVFGQSYYNMVELE